MIEAPTVILGPYKAGYSAERACFAQGIGRVTFMERDDGSAEAILHDITDEDSGDAKVVEEVGVTPIGLRVDSAVVKALERISATVSILEKESSISGGR